MLYCNGNPDNNVKLYLYNKNLLRKATLLSQTLTDTNGNFELMGNKPLHRQMRPFILLQHYCNERDFRCKIMAMLSIPTQNVYRGTTIVKPLEMGYVELVSIRNQKKICVPRNLSFRKRTKRE
ncbi:Transthyretin-like family-containing protein [Strongyloides ratti]|uniref:Transthyretin-like family-containing protein n=1 Tax=Strongyloides ratti TaxID=34506 RepID=A0A090LQA2_STRRB|nr:Transthyretin-like family-containing protein [Strongyloides ratti]CEF69721.1 Transthyretin-like family-containing protein [Strongyloides ratti]